MVKWVKGKKQHRSEICYYFMQGNCRMGDKCKYKHDKNPEKMPECRELTYFGNCFNKKCPFLHNKSSKAECYYYNKGFCKFGPKCRFGHVRRELCPLFDKCGDKKACGKVHL